ncbi:flagellar motor switch protein FliM [Orenia marismortui]|uniref:Flagellar motor switch protein FliM n=1 Tax=Orenia marismortui TaxID=46469 RepID=A0A4R8GZ50_9FIRM|nr:flagellar motor switch protein FliM [Orenia marismortui]TDX51921.1 flagellar motor switch protein FliM [Orenia marismortui]
MSSNRVLSQNEIDSLLDALSSGEMEADELKDQEDELVEAYDFKHPNKLSKDQLRTLRMVYEGFARLLSTSISTQLRTMTKVELTSIDQLSYEEFISSLPQPTILSVCDFYPLHGEFLIEINPKIGYAIIERFFGGDAGDSSGTLREFTDIEEVVLKKINKTILDSFSESWENVVDLRPRVKELESNPQFTQIVPNNDMVILATFEANIGKVDGLINISIPYIVLEPIVSKLSAQYWFSSTRKDSAAESLSKIKKRLGKAKLPVEAELGKANIKIAQLLQLTTGDVIKLDNKVSDNLSLYINKKEKFLVKPGKCGSKLAVEITSAISEDEWEDEDDE